MDEFQSALSMPSGEQKTVAVLMPDDRSEDQARRAGRTKESVEATSGSGLAAAPEWKTLGEGSPMKKKKVNGEGEHRIRAGRTKNMSRDCAGEPEECGIDGPTVQGWQVGRLWWPKHRIPSCDLT